MTAGIADAENGFLDHAFVSGGKKNEVFRYPSLAGGWLAGWGVNGVTGPNGGPITSRLQGCWLLAGGLAGLQAAGS